MNQVLNLLPLLLLLLLLRPVLGADDGSLQCRDANGDPLDWFAALKQPQGPEYAYITSTSPDSWIQPIQPNLTTGGPVFATVGQLFAKSAAASADVLAAYNDEPPPKDSTEAQSSAFGHMKGVVALTAGQRGFWLIHSVPKFPDLNMTAYSYPPTGLMYGQSFLCITVNSSSMAETIGRQLFASHPDLYRIDVSPAAMSSWPSWADLKSRKQPPAQLLNSSAHLLTADGLPVLHVAKSAHLNQDLYSYLLAGLLDSSIQVETWQHGPRLLNSTCGRRYNVTKVLRVRIGALQAFNSTGDHSKWCVSTGGNAGSGKPYVCIGDMNRADSQFKRGGGVACIQLPGLHRLFKAAVLSDQACHDQGRNSGSRYDDDNDDMSDDLTEDARGGYESTRESGKDNAAELLVLFNWVMIAVFCAVACTAVSALLVLWLAVGQATAGARQSGSRYRAL